MSKDYVLFVHGVNVREPANKVAARQYGYADQLFQRIQQSSSGLNLVKVPLYWGDVSESSLGELRSLLQDPSGVWNQLWFKEFRNTQLLQFVGDAALYISRHVGAKAIDQMTTDAFEQLQHYEPGDRLHLVAHSWGTVILFDVLFASRWDNPNLQDGQSLPGYGSVQKIRSNFYGLEPSSNNGLRLASISTMGSPIALFSLITTSGTTADGASTHDLTPGLNDLLKKLYERDRVELPWQNFIHPGDPIAYPLQQVVKRVIRADKYVDIRDMLTSGSGGWEMVARLFQQSFLALVNGGSAHGSYWQNQQVAQSISRAIQKSAAQTS